MSKFATQNEGKSLRELFTSEDLMIGVLRSTIAKNLDLTETDPLDIEDLEWLEGFLEHLGTDR